jgi:dephospho-CoA kinase
MFSVGLTGGIASGKTTISNLFAARGVAIIDTDVISRALLEPGESTFDQVCQHFGETILTGNRSIDRARLREIVFNDPVQKRWLETMLHPLIFRRSQEAITQQGGDAYVLVVVPLLFETNFQALVDRVLAVDCPAETQIRRLIKRDDIDESLARKMLAQQLSNDERLARAHDVIENRSDDSSLEQQVDRLHASYLELARG